MKLPLHFKFIMKNIFLISSLTVICFNIFAADKWTPSEIKEVTVYLNGARISRTAQAKLNPGINEIVFGGLSNFVDDKSVEVRSNGNATILAVSYRINNIRYQQKNDYQLTLENSLDSASYKLESVRNEKYTYEQELLLLTDNRKVSGGDKTIFVDDVEDLANFFRKRMLEIKNKITILSVQERDILEKYEAIKKQADQYNADNRIPSGEIVVRCSSTGYVMADFSIGYFTGNSGWSPVYSLRAVNVNQPVKLDFDAIVTQKSGEDWKNVRLTLSTGNPTMSSTKPELNTWFVNVNDIRFKRKNNFEAKLEKDQAISGSVTAKEETQGEDMNNDYASDYTTVSENQLNVSFEINLKYDIPADGSGHQVRIQQYDLAGVYEYAAIPKMDKDAFLLAKVSGWEDYNLLPGPSNLFFEGTYVGKSYLDPNITTDTLALSFGRDKKIVISRNKVKDFSKKQLLGGYKTQTFAYEINIRSLKDAPINITIEDQIPVSQNKELEVELKENGKAEYDPSTGKLKWKLKLAPSETQTMRFVYTVKYPKDKVVNGLY